MNKTITNVLVATAAMAVMSMAFAQISPVVGGSAADGRKEKDGEGKGRREARFTKAVIITLVNGNEQTYYPPREGSQGQITLRAEEANAKGRTLREFVALKGQRPEVDGKIYGELTIFSASEDSPSRREVVYGYFPKNNFLDIPPVADIFYHAVFESREKKVLIDRLADLPKFSDK